MTNPEADYRLKLAEGYLDEARQDASTGRWRSCADSSQLAAENAAKAVLAMIGPVGRTHDPGAILLEELNKGRFPQAIESQVRRIAECAEQLGSEVHLETAYGDEAARRTPWEIFDEKKARAALRFAEEAVTLAKQVIEGGQRP
jgi:HEPN domain-containing protein